MSLLGSPTRRRLIALGIALVLLVIVVAAVLAATSRGGASTSSQDAALKRTAERALPSLNRLNSKFPVQDASLPSFQAWVYGSQRAFTTLIHTIRRPQVAQLQFMDPNVMPPQSLSLTAPGHPGVFVDASTMTHVNLSHQPTYATVQQGGQTYRVYVVPLTTPAPLTPTGSTGMLVVYEPQ